MTTKKQANKTKLERKLKRIEHFAISYDATDEEYSAHKIKAENLVKILQETISLVKRSDKLLNGSRQTVEIYTQNIDSNQIIRNGSVQIPFAIEVYEYVAQAMSTVSVIDTKDVLKALGFSIATGAVGFGVFKGIFSTNGEPVLDVRTMDNSNEVEILTENTKYSTDSDTAILMQDSQIRQAIKNLTVEPLLAKQHGSFKIIQQNKTINEETQKAEVKETVTLSFKPEDKIDTLTKLSENVYPDPEISETEEVIKITQINFSTGKSGWKILLNGKERNVELRDVAFIDSINANEASFRKGDWLKVKLQSIKTFGTTVRTSYIITEVMEHLVEQNRKLIGKNNE
ncbi:hypothetical protein [Lonepinella sp. BR2882]|uniref:hypothetical protein n=1 Tax=Lonepinella sp. BR2882 TaxID=3095283 RepID=UPI003F6E374C